MLENRQANAQLFPQYFLLSATASAFSKLLCTPLEKAQIGIIQSLNTPKSNQSYLSNLARISKEEGFLSLWKGSTAGLVKYSLILALNFSLNDLFKRTFFDYNSKTDFWKFMFGNLASGAIAGAFSFCLLSRAKVSGYEHSQNGRPDTLKNLYPNIGVKFPEILIHRAIYFGGYDIFKKMVFSEEDKSGIVGKYLIAQGVTILSQFASLPLTIARDRYECQLLAQEAKSEILPPGLRDQIRKISSEEGYKGLWKGFGRSLPGLIAPALTLAIYDEVKTVLHKNGLIKVRTWSVEKTSS